MLYLQQDSRPDMNPCSFGAGQEGPFMGVNGIGWSFIFVITELSFRKTLCKLAIYIITSLLDDIYPVHDKMEWCSVINIWLLDVMKTI